MLTCPVCGDELNHSMICGCGFDCSTDREQYPTLMTPEAAMPSRHSRTVACLNLFLRHTGAAVIEMDRRVQQLQNDAAAKDELLQTMQGRIRDQEVRLFGVEERLRQIDRQLDRLEADEKDRSHHSPAEDAAVQRQIDNLGKRIDEQKSRTDTRLNRMKNRLNAEELFTAELDEKLRTAEKRLDELDARLSDDSDRGKKRTPLPLLFGRGKTVPDEDRPDEDDPDDHGSHHFGPAPRRL